MVSQSRATCTPFLWGWRYGHLVGRAQGCCATFCRAQDAPPPTIRNYPVQNANSTESEKPCTMLTCTFCQEKQFFKPNDLKQNTSKVNRYKTRFVVWHLSPPTFCKIPRHGLKQIGYLRLRLWNHWSRTFTLWPLLQSIKISKTAACDLEGSRTEQSTEVIYHEYFFHFPFGGRLLRWYSPWVWTANIWGVLAARQGRKWHCEPSGQSSWLMGF